MLRYIAAKNILYWDMVTPSHKEHSNSKDTVALTHVYVSQRKK